MNEKTTPSAERPGDLRIPQPQPVTRFLTSDNKVHESELDAIAHETFLTVNDDMPATVRLSFGRQGNIAYEIVVALAKKYHFTPRSVE